jgi:hypothetical protein
MERCWHNYLKVLLVNNSEEDNQKMFYIRRHILKCNNNYRNFVPYCQDYASQNQK